MVQCRTSFKQCIIQLKALNLNVYLKQGNNIMYLTDIDLLTHLICNKYQS